MCCPCRNPSTLFVRVNRRICNRLTAESRCPSASCTPCRRIAWKCFHFNNMVRRSLRDHVQQSAVSCSAVAQKSRAPLHQQPTARRAKSKPRRQRESALLTDCLEMLNSSAAHDGDTPSTSTRRAASRAGPSRRASSSASAENWSGVMPAPADATGLRLGSVLF